MIDSFKHWLEAFNWNQVFVFLVAFTASLFVARILIFVVNRTITSHLPAGKQAFVRKLGFYFLVVLALLGSLNFAGFNITWLMGAAGIFSVAIGFASQTSASNFISGLFLLGERPFQEGDTILIEDIQGQVLSIDMLSVKIRTFENLFVRIPNETMIKSKLTNYTKFGIRRLEIPVGLAYRTDLHLAEQVLLGVARDFAPAMRHPEPEFRALSFGDSAIQCSLLVWVNPENFPRMRTELIMRIQTALAAAGIEIPFPQRVVSINREEEPTA
ncbi:MAG: mechanosensitive ion channel family protein [Acidobacteria bacterium]|nr:mechanosensitive ion channel family protein [Acidobacteriota bacterium]